MKRIPDLNHSCKYKLRKPLQPNLPHSGKCGPRSFRKTLWSFLTFQEKCPNCGRRGEIVPHDHYLVDPRDKVKITGAARIRSCICGYITETTSLNIPLPVYRGNPLSERVTGWTDCLTLRSYDNLVRPFLISVFWSIFQNRSFNPIAGLRFNVECVSYLQFSELC